jgi:phage terminase small subunit
MITNKKHLLFADEYILSNDAIVSYQKAYPKAKSESARVESYKILQNPTIAKYIKEKQDKIRLERENSVIDAIKKESNINILQREKAIEMVSNVAKLMYNQLAKNGDKKPADVMAFNSTVERLAKMDGWDKPTKQEQTIIEKRIVDDLYIEE